jgi:hypothetical protein
MNENNLDSVVVQSSPRLWNGSGSKYLELNTAKCDSGSKTCLKFGVFSMWNNQFSAIVDLYTKIFSVSFDVIITRLSLFSPRMILTCERSITFS